LKPYSGEKPTSLIFTNSETLVEKLQIEPYYPKEGQPIAYCNEGVVNYDHNRCLELTKERCFFGISLIDLKLVSFRNFFTISELTTLL
jgi:hypothetical protein